MKHFFRLGTATRDPARARPVTGQPVSRITLPPPVRSGGKPIMDAFSHRRTTRRFATTDLDEATLGQLLWAANGINRSGADDDSGRTAPSVLALHEIDVYAALPYGMYCYEPLQHCLDLVSAVDLRGLTGYQDFVGEAPLELVYVADLARMHDSRPTPAR